MLVSRIPYEAFAATVAKVGANEYAGNLMIDRSSGPSMLNQAGTRFRVRIRTVSSRQPGSRRSWTGRRIPAACWHAFRDVYTEVFESYPDARIDTMHARYLGRAGFHDTYPATRWVNVGSQMFPVTLPQLCDCADSGA